MDRRKQEVIEYYDKYACIYNETRYGPNKQRTTDITVMQKSSMLGGDITNKLVLDAGCGTGYWTEFLVKKGAHLVSLDASQNMLAILTKSIPDAKVLRGDILCLPFKDTTFDLIVCSQVLTHLHQYKRPLIELKRVLKDDGVMIIDVRNALHPLSMLWLLRERIVRKRIFTKLESLRDPAYSPHFTCIWKIKKICREIGLEVRDFTGCGYPSAIKYISPTLLMKIVKVDWAQKCKSRVR